MEGACEFFTQSVVSALGCKRAHLSIRIPSCLLSCQSVHCLFLFLSFWRVVYGPVSRCWQIRFYEKILMLPFVDSLSLSLLAKVVKIDGFRCVGATSVTGSCSLGCLHSFGWMDQTQARNHTHLMEPFSVLFCL